MASNGILWALVDADMMGKRCNESLNPSGSAFLVPGSSVAMQSAGPLHMSVQQTTQGAGFPGYFLWMVSTSPLGPNGDV